MALKASNDFVNLVIKETKPSLRQRFRKQYRVCTLTKKRNQQVINLRVPESVQDRIVSAYEQGKTVRIYA